MRSANDSGKATSSARHVPEAVHLAFSSFLAVPTAVVALFLLLAVATYLLNRANPPWVTPLRDPMKAHVFGDSAATAALLSTVAGSVITVASITFSLLLLTLQQSAGTMTHAVFDQFLRRRINQAYAGWFVGLSLYALITLATVDQQFNPVLGGTVTLLLVAVALYVLLLLTYAAIEQMRPGEIVRAVHDHTLRARDRQRELIGRTRRELEVAGPVRRTVHGEVNGFVVDVDLPAIEAGLARFGGSAVLLRLPIGAYVAYGDAIADVAAQTGDAASALADLVQPAIRIQGRRDLSRDAAFGIEQIETIAWTSISTSKQNPSPGLDAVHNLRDLLARWAADEQADPSASSQIAYPDDVVERLFGTFESLAIVASESMQHQITAALYEGLAATVERLPAELQRRSEQVVLRTLPGLGDHVLSAELDDALTVIAEAFARAGLVDGQAAVVRARAGLAESVGQLRSRATRA